VMQAAPQLAQLRLGTCVRSQPAAATKRPAQCRTSPTPAPAWGSRGGQSSKPARETQPAGAGFKGCDPQSGIMICLKAACTDSPHCALTLPHSGYHPSAPSRSGGGRHMAGSTSACMECRETTMFSLLNDLHCRLMLAHSACGSLV
jgi:hypothetical protein